MESAKNRRRSTHFQSARKDEWPLRPHFPLLFAYQVESAALLARRRHLGESNNRLHSAYPMEAKQPQAVTDLLRRWRRGDEEAIDELIAAVYPELHRLAAGYLRGEQRDHTLQPTALVNEAYLRLVGGAEVDYNDRMHFLVVAARTMRRVLVDHARAKRALKRGGSQVRVTWSDSKLGTLDGTPDVLDLDASLRRLADLDERKSEVIELHFFGGLTYDETAAALGVSLATVNRDLRFAKAWLADDMRPASG